MYSVKTDQRTGMIEIVISGFLMPSDLEGFCRDLGRETDAVRSTGRTHVTLYDYTHAVIQSQDTVAVLGRMARENPHGARKTAIYTAGRLARRQASRIADAGEHVRMFEDRTAAIEWLRDQPAP